MENPLNPSLLTRPIELYVFIDPTCSECWRLQPVLRKLQVAYEKYFTLRVILRTSLPTMNLPCTSNDNSYETCEKSHPSFPAIAIKAAEFQGKRAGQRFISKLFEYSYLKSRNVTSFSVLVEIAELLHLDVNEFIRDFTSRNVHRSLQIDLFMSQEMEVEHAPTFVFFNSNIEDEGLKVSGIYDFDVYVQILEELIGQAIIPDSPPPLENLFSRYDTLTTMEIANIYGITEKSAERELKKRLLQQDVERMAFNDTTLWRKNVINKKSCRSKIDGSFLY
nr:DsbA family protein [Sporosarcina jiandibaonis]